MHIKYYIEPRLLNTEINTTAFWNIRFSIDADTAVVSQAAPLSARGKLLPAILSFTMQAQICSAPLFVTSLRASWLRLIAQNRVFVWQFNANVDCLSF